MVENSPRVVGLFRIERVAIPDSDRGDSQIAAFGFFPQHIRGAPPVGIARPTSALLKARPFEAAEAESLNNFQRISVASRKHSQTHPAIKPVWARASTRFAQRAGQATPKTGPQPPRLP